MKTAIAQKWAREYIARETVEAEIENERRQFQARLEADAENRLAEFDAETNALAARAAKDCDETLFVKLSAKQQMRPHYATKLKAEADKKLAEFKPSQVPPEISANYCFMDFIAESENELRGGIRRCFQAEVAADRVFNDSDSGRWFWRFHRFGITPEQRTGIIRAAADGQPENLPWNFT